MKYLVKYKYVVLCICAALFMQSCDWVKGKMGMPTSKDIEQMKAELQLKEQQMLKEQERALKLQDSIMNAQQEQKAPVLEGFYLVLGSFKDYKNAESFEALVKKNGYPAQQVLLKNGYMMVVVGGYARFGEASKEMGIIGEKDFCPYDMWVYHPSQGLHQEQ